MPQSGHSGGQVGGENALQPDSKARDPVLGADAVCLYQGDETCIKKAEYQELMLLNCGVGEDS